MSDASKPLEGGADEVTDRVALSLGRAILGQPLSFGVVFVDVQGTIDGWSAGAARLTGWTEDEAVGRPFSMMFVDSDRRLRLDLHELQTARTLGVAEDERWHLRKDGSTFWSSGVSVPLTREAGSGFVKIFRDATHLRARAAIRESEVDELRRELVERDTLLASVAHELRNPLVPIQHAIELLRKAPGNGAQSRAIDAMSRQAKAMESLVEDLVDTSRLRVGKFKLHYQSVELQTLLAEAIETCAAHAGERGVELRTVMPPQPIRLEADPVRMHQVLVNLVRNAIKFTGPAGRVSVVATADSDHCLTQIIDNGAGIGPELMPKIFQMFTQASTARAQRGDGLGIGLALAKEIVVAHSGSIEVRSEGPGKGSEFLVRLPVKASPADAA